MTHASEEFAFLQQVCAKAFSGSNSISIKFEIFYPYFGPEYFKELF